MTLLTPGEYDDLPQECKDALQQVVRQPTYNVKSSAYRKQRGKYLNGDIEGDPVVEQIVGYGTGLPTVPHSVN